MNELEDFRLARGSLSGIISLLSPPNTSSSSGSIGMAAWSECVAVAAKSGAGGRGLRGVPPYSDGVPGRGLPFRSAGSYDGRIGEERWGDRCLGGALNVGGGSVGVPRLEPGLECDLQEGVEGLSILKVLGSTLCC